MSEKNIPSGSPDPNIEDSMKAPGQDSLNRCTLMLKQASTDTEKFAALLMVTKLVKTDTLDEVSSKKLLDAIGLNFLGRMLSTKDVPEGCPSYMFKSIALTVLSCFVPSCHGDPALHRLIPHLAEIISNTKLYEEDLTLIKEAFQCLQVIASETTGRKALVSYEVIGTLVDAYVSENMFHEQALEILCCIATHKECKMWDDEPEAFTRLMNCLCKEFSIQQNAQKFYLCEVLANIIPSIIDDYDKLPEIGSWEPLLHKGISDILFSKLSHDFRNKGLHLASVILEVLGLSFIVNGGDKGQQLLLIMVHLACIEVRMSLEDKSFEESLCYAWPTTACYSIIEEAIKFLINGAVDLEGKQKQQLYAALKGAFGGVLEFLNGASTEDILTNSYKTQVFIYASIKVLAAWLAEETAANKEEIYKLLPFLIQMAKHNFNTIYSKPVKSKKKNAAKETVPVVKDNSDVPPNILRFLLPGLCHLTAEDCPRQILLGLDIETLLLDYVLQLWNTDSNSENDVCDNRSAAILNCDPIITICNIFMNIVVQEPMRVKSDLLYFRLLKFILSKLPTIPTDSVNLQLIGCFCTLGLMILRHQCSNISNTDMGIFRFIQSTVRFLWDGYNVEESSDYATLVVASAYEQIWEDLAEFWFISMQTLTLLLPNVPWICDFLIESEWPQAIIETFLLIKKDGIEAGVKTAYEDFLCTLVESSKTAREIMLIKGIVNVCRNQKLDKLSSCLGLTQK